MNMCSVNICHNITYNIIMCYIVWLNLLHLILLTLEVEVTKQFKLNKNTYVCDSTCSCYFNPCKSQTV
jgi:hypothetical protein